MNAFEKLHIHHEKLINTIKSLAHRAEENPADTSLLLSYCNEFLVSHAEAEEVTLYTADDDTNFVNDMIHEHKEIKHSLDVIDAAFSRGEILGLITEINNFMALLNNHFQEEENTLMPRISKKMSEQELESLIAEAHQIESEKKKADVWSLFEYDHKRIDLNISQMQNSKGNVDKIKKYYSKIRSQLLKHIELEETLLFTSFGEHATPDQMGPVQVMIAEHREIASYISTPADRLDEAALSSIPTRSELVSKLAVHNKKEELILYPMINRTLPRRERENVFKESFEQLTKV
ncbi:MAG: hemerythrin domain-containing protein [Bacteroidetes bacterium]|nr:hemerythrin domain-containing protein [Bacteroidota bacterium]MCL5738480.1 hemerythrin domain-containing protein [Bacteroidota bacterium]